MSNGIKAVIHAVLGGAAISIAVYLPDGSPLLRAVVICMACVLLVVAIGYAVRFEAQR